MKRIPALLALLTVTPASAALPLQVDKLDNGLRVVTVPMAGAPTVAFFTLVLAGSRDEVEPGRSGYAHLFEHLMFRGTEKVPASDYERRMQALGSDNNAFTTDDFTFFIPLVPKEGLAELVTIEADRFKHLDVPEAPYRDETGAVAGEFNKDFSNPWWAMDEAIRELAFTQHTYGHTVIGYKRDVDAMPRNHAYAKTFFSRFYVPDDCVIFAVGDVERDRVLELVKASYGDWRGHRAEPLVHAEPEQTAPRRKDLVWKTPTAPRLLVGYKSPSARTALGDVAALGVLATLVFGTPGELYQRLVVRDQKVLDMSADPDEVIHKDPSLFRVDLKLKDGTSFDDVLGAVQAALDAAAAGKTDLKELEAARDHLLRSITLAMQTPSATAERLAFLTAATGDVHGYDAYMKAVAEVGAEAIVRVAKLLTPAHRTTITLTGPKR